jgi:hypothetical protein
MRSEGQLPPNYISSELRGIPVAMLTSLVDKLVSWAILISDALRRALFTAQGPCILRRTREHTGQRQASVAKTYETEGPLHES